MKSILYIDFETQSACELKDCGVDVYAKHWSTEALCMGYAFDDEKVSLWKHGSWLYTEIQDFISSGGIVVGHNVGNFEYNIWNEVCAKKYGWPKLRAEQIHDTMAMANAMGLPSSLGMAAPAAGLKELKDHDGYRVMMKLSKPRQKGTHADGTEWANFWKYEEQTEAYEKLYEYCKQDVEVERALYKKLNKLSEKERAIWLLDHKINARGVGIDLPSVKQCARMVEHEQYKLAERLLYLTARQVPSPAAHVAFKRWLQSQGMGQLDSIDKEAITNLLEHENLPDHVREALEIRKNSAKSSTAKLYAMMRGCTKGRARNCFEYYGAKQTGRWAGRRLQLHNMPRPKLEMGDIEDAITRFRSVSGWEEIRMLYGSVMQTASDCLRAFIIPAGGCKFMAADFSNIEGRALAWLAGEEWKLEAFRDFDKGTGPDLYVLAYAKAFRKSVNEVTKDERQVGKVIELSMGYAGGVGAFHNMAKNYGVKKTDEEAEEIKNGFRSSNPNITAYWQKTNDAFMSALKDKGVAYGVGKGNARVVYKLCGSFGICRLPSGRLMYYPYPAIWQQIWTVVYNPLTKRKISKTFHGPNEQTAQKAAQDYAKKNKLEIKEFGAASDVIVYKSYDSVTKQWGYTPTYGGSLVENLCQAISRDVLADAMLRVEAKGYPIVLTCHDEIVVEVKDSPAYDLKTYEDLMSEIPSWATNFPIVAKGWEGYRYRK